MAPKAKPGPGLAELLRFIAKHERLAFAEAEFGLAPDEVKSQLEIAARALVPKADGKPNFPKVMVYSDGAARGNPGLSGAGAVLVGPNGQVIDRVGKFLGVKTNNFAEYTGLLLGLRRAKQLGVREVEVFADSELMIRQLGGRYQVKSPKLKPLYEQALKLLESFSRTRLVHVPRRMNKAADEMSNRAIDERL